MNDEQREQLLAELRRLNDSIDAGKVKARDADGGREAAALDGAAQVATQLSALTREQRMAEIGEAVKAQLAQIHLPSAQGIIGQGPSLDAPQGRMIRNDSATASPALKASFRDYQSGELMSAMLDYKGIGMGGIDVSRIGEGKAKLDELGLFWASNPEGKATLGTSGATGGYVLPNNLVDTLVKPNVQEAVYTGANPLVTVINGVNVRGVDQPYRTGAPTRLTSTNWGALKDNRDEEYGSYTATLGTFAAIYDIGKQYARFSAGAAERDVMDELTKAAGLAENYAVIAGPGTGALTPGTNDPTLGVYTALMNATPTYTTAFAAASNSTVAGSIAAALAGLAGTLAGRSRRLEAAVMDTTTYWRLFSQGSDSAGFWMSAALGAGFTFENGGVAWNGVPLRYDANLGTNAATKILIGGEWKTVKFYRGMEFRIDTSDVAGTRWDYNLIGFRGEEEYGINASTAVAVGALQLVTAAIP